MDKAERERLRWEYRDSPYPKPVPVELPIVGRFMQALDALEEAEAAATRYRECIREWQDQDPYPWLEDSDRCHYCGHNGGANRSHYPECAWQQARDLLAAMEPEGQ